MTTTLRSLVDDVVIRDEHGEEVTDYSEYILALSSIVTGAGEQTNYRIDDGPGAALVRAWQDGGREMTAIWEQATRGELSAASLDIVIVAQ